MKRKFILASFIIITFLMIKLSVTSNAATATVTTETLNLREEASTSSNVIELLNASDELEIISQEGNWYKVKHGANTGYVSKDYVKVSGTVSAEENNTNVPETVEKEVGEKITVKGNTSIKILPLINAKVISKVSEDKEAEIIAKTNKWLFVAIDNITGWVQINGESTTASANITEVNTTDNETTGTNTSESEIEATQTYSEVKTKYINVNSAYIRSEASTSSSIVTTLIRNTDVKVTGESGDWYKVKYGDYSGYIYKELLSDTKTETTNRSGETLTRISNDEQAESEQISTSSSKGEEVVQYAKQYLGCSYVYGGSGPSTFDCSGFTMYVYKNFGYSLSHSATAQSYVGTAVEKSNLQPGDLVFFSDYETLTGIGHCGIYIGDGEFIHASSGSGYCVKVSTLLTGSYNTRYVTARRLL